jgi:hypothetical protein
VVVPLCRRWLEALADRSHRPRSCPHQMAAEVEVRLVSCAGCIRGGVPARRGSARCELRFHTIRGCRREPG